MWYFNDIVISFIRELRLREARKDSAEDRQLAMVDYYGSQNPGPRQGEM